LDEASNSLIKIAVYFNQRSNLSFQITGKHEFLHGSSTGRPQSFAGLRHMRLQNETSFWTVNSLVSGLAMSLDAAENICVEG